MRILALLPLLGLIACTISPEGPDAGALDGGPPLDGGQSVDGGESVDAGPLLRYHYVVDSMMLPTDSSQADQYGLDLDGDGTVDNQLGNILSALVQAAGSSSLDAQGFSDALVDKGEVLLLADLGTRDLNVSAEAPFLTFKGASPSPAPCTDPNNLTTCRQHLSGTGTFALAALPQDPALAGTIASGVYQGGPGLLTFQLPLFGRVSDLVLHAARAKLTGASATGISAGILAGGITQADLSATVIPFLHLAFVDMATRDCTGGSPPGCGCVSGSSGAVAIALFDANADCSIDIAEFENNSLIHALFQPDLTVGGESLLSVGVGVTAVKGTFAVPGE